MAQPNPPGNKGKDLLTEDPENKRKDVNKNGNERNENMDKENLLNREKKDEGRDNPADLGKDGKKKPGAEDDENIIDENEDVVEDDDDDDDEEDNEEDENEDDEEELEKEKVL